MEYRELFNEGGDEFNAVKAAMKAATLAHYEEDGSYLMMRPVRSFVSNIAGASREDVEEMLRIDRWAMGGAIFGMFFAGLDVVSDVAALYNWVRNGSQMWVAGFAILAVSFFVNSMRILMIRKEASTVRIFYSKVLKFKSKRNNSIPELRIGDSIPLLVESHCGRNTDGKMKRLPNQLTSKPTLLEEAIPNTDSTKFIGLFLLSAMAPSIFMNAIWLMGTKKINSLIQKKQTFEDEDALVQLYARSSFLYFIQLQAADACKLELLMEAIPQLLLRILPVLSIFLKLGFSLAVDKIGIEEVQQLTVSFLSIGYLMAAAMLKKQELAHYEGKNRRTSQSYPRILKLLCIIGHILTIGTIIIGAGLVFLSSILTGLLVFLICNCVVMSSGNEGYSWESRLFQGWTTAFSPLEWCKRRELCLRIIMRMFFLRGLGLSLVLLTASLQLLKIFPLVNVAAVTFGVLSVHILGDSILIAERLMSPKKINWLVQYI